MDFSFAQQHIARLYSDCCTVIEKQTVKEGNISYTDGEVQVYTDIPCRISFNRGSSAKITTQTDIATDLNQIIRLSLSPEYIIKPGSKIIVTRAGRSTTYKSSGQPSVFTSHQEIALELDDDRA